MADTVGINVVFTDLVGSTEMSSRLGPEKTEEMRVIHFGLLRGALEQFGGIEVKNLGDGLMIVFPSLGNALDGSVAMQQAIDRHNNSGKEPLGVRVGISTGDATEEDGDYFGEPVVEAARLCAKCDSGQIIVSQLLSMLARNSGHSFTSIGELDLRGVPDPVLSMTVDWDPVEATGAVPTPERLVRDIDLRIAGRTMELEALSQALKDAEGGSRRVTFLAGEPGIGKTRLCCELAEQANSRGVLTLYGRCDEELSLPYQPWVEAITYLVGNSPSGLIDDAIGLHGPELAQIVPQIRRRFPDVEAPPPTDPETERYHLLQAVTGFVSEISKGQPVLLVLDDLHWADKPSLTLLRHLLTNGGATRLMIIGTYRDSDLGVGHPLINTVAALRREPGVEQISVRGLGDDEMVDLISISAEHDLDAEMIEMAHSLRQETAGNPFFAHEILRNLVEVGDVVLGDDGRWRVEKTLDELTLPQSVRDVVGQRIARMGEESLKALRAAAVVGKEFDLELLADVTGADEDDLLDLLESAIAAGILAEVPGAVERFQFLHTLTRNTLQSDLSDGRRRRLHRKIAESLEASIGHDPGDRVSELATHWLAAAVSVDNSKATEYARLAGKQAEASLAPDEAVRWFRTALESLDELNEPDLSHRAQLLMDLGVALRNSGDAEYRQTLLDAGELARSVGDTNLMAEIAISNNRGMYSKLGERDDDRIAALEAALEAVGDGRTTQRAMLLATYFSELEYAETFENRAAIITEAESIARDLGDERVLCAVLNRSCVTSAAPHNLHARLEASAESLAIAQRQGDDGLEFWAWCGVFQSAMGNRDLEGGRKALDALTTLAEDSSRPTFRWVAGNLAVTMLSATGDPDGVEATATANFALGTDNGEPDAFDYYAVGLMTARWMQGRSREVMDQMIAAAESIEIGSYRAVTAMMFAEASELELAAQHLEYGKSRDFDFRVNNTWSTTLAPYGVAATLVGDREAAALIYDALLPWAGQLVTTQAFSWGLLDGVLGGLAAILGKSGQAEAHFITAEATAQAAGLHWSSAMNDLARAEFCRSTDQIDRAKDYVSRCVVTSQEHGYAALEQRAHRLLCELAGATPRPPGRC